MGKRKPQIRPGQITVGCERKDLFCCVVVGCRFEWKGLDFIHCGCNARVKRAGSSGAGWL